MPSYSISSSSRIVPSSRRFRTLVGLSTIRRTPYLDAWDQFLIANNHSESLPIQIRLKFWFWGKVSVGQLYIPSSPCLKFHVPMAASVSKPDGFTSSESSTLQEPHEQTPLLESNRDTNTTSTSAGHLASQLWWPNPPAPASEDIISVPESVSEQEDEKLSTSIVGVISVLLLGT